MGKDDKVNSHTDKFNANTKFAISSGTPVIGSKLGVLKIGQGKYAIQSGIPRIGATIGVNGGFSPSTILPGEISKVIRYWTAKTAYYHHYRNEGGTLKDRIIDSAFYLYKLDTAGTIIQEIDLEPVICKLIHNLTNRSSAYERQPRAPYWINRWRYDKYLNWDSHVTTASPDYLDIPISYQTHKVAHTGGDVNAASSYIRPASYAGILGPVYANVASPTNADQVYTATIKPQYSACAFDFVFPWKEMRGPADPCNYHVRDILEDVNGNLWVLLQLGWVSCDVWGQPLNSSPYYGYECRVGVKYDDGYARFSTAAVESAPVYDPNNFPRQHVIPQYTHNRAALAEREWRSGIPKPQMFLVMFSKKTNYTSWDYIPFCVNTCGFRGKYYSTSNNRGPTNKTIVDPPIRLDTDSYGNVYAAVGTALIYESNYSTYFRGIGFNYHDLLYFYRKSDSELPAGTAIDPVSGLEVGRIGPYPSIKALQSDTLGIDTGCYVAKNPGDYPSKTCHKSPWTFTMGGGAARITRYSDWKSLKVASYNYTVVGNRSIRRDDIKIDYTVASPRPVTCAYTPQRAPSNFRRQTLEWAAATTPELAMEMDLLFAHCDFLTRNYYGCELSAGNTVQNCQVSSPSMLAFDPASWWEYEEPWRLGSINTRTHINTFQEVHFRYGNSTGENPPGFKAAEHPEAWITHLFRDYGTNGVWRELEFQAYSGTDTRNTYNYYQYGLPLQKGADTVQDIIYRPASTPYSITGAPAGSDWFEHNMIMGLFPSFRCKFDNEDVIIKPGYDFKNEIVAFSAITWDTYQHVRNVYGFTLTNMPYPHRWHTSKRYPEKYKNILTGVVEVASEMDLDFDNYGPRTSLLDSSGGLYQTIPNYTDCVFKYTQNYIATIAETLANIGQPDYKQAYDSFMQLITNVKWLYWERYLGDLNYGAGGDASGDDTTFALWIPLFEFDATGEYSGGWNINGVLDTDTYRRLYIITPNTKTDYKWALQSVSDTFHRWMPDGTIGNDQTILPVANIDVYDIPGEQITKSKGWDAILDPDYDYIIEKWESAFAFSPKKFPMGDRNSPQFYGNKPKVLT